MSNAFSAHDTTRMLFRRMWIIAVAALVFGVSAYIYTLKMPLYYKSTINCVPASNDNQNVGGSLGGFSSALKDIGLSKIGGGHGNEYEYIVVLFTRSIRDSMINRFHLAEEYGINPQLASAVRDEFESNLDVDLKAEGNYVISIWDQDRVKASDMCKAFVQYANDIYNRVQHEDAIKTSQYLQERIRSIDSTYSALTDSLTWYSKNYHLFAPEEQSKAVASALGDITSDLLKQQLILGLMERSYGSDDPQVRSQQVLVKNIENQYNDFLSKPDVSGTMGLQDMTGVSAHFLRISAELEGMAKLKTFLLPSLEQAQLDINKTSPSLLVVDQPLPAEKKDKPKRMLITAGAALGASVITILVLLLIQAWKNFSKT